MIAAPGLLEKSLCLTCFFNTWGKGCHVQLLLIDFSSAFNTIQPHIWIQRLLEHFDLSNNLVGWFLDWTLRVWVDVFLCASPQLHHKAIIYPLLLLQCFGALLIIDLFESMQTTQWLLCTALYPTALTNGVSNHLRLNTPKTNVMTSGVKKPFSHTWSSKHLDCWTCAFLQIPWNY